MEAEHKHTEAQKHFFKYVTQEEQDECNRNVSITALCIAIDLERFERAVEILQRHNLCIGDLKYVVRPLAKAFDNFFYVFKKFSPMMVDFTEDCEELGDIIDSFSKMDNENWN